MNCYRCHAEKDEVQIGWLGMFASDLRCRTPECQAIDDAEDRIYASGPALLEAAEHAFNCFGGPWHPSSSEHEAVEALRAAIVEARGRPQEGKE